MGFFKHLILTTFNLEYPRGNRPHLTPAWLDHRFDLFDRFCFPSVRSQAGVDFEWLVFFHEMTPEGYRKRINEYAKWKPFVPIYSCPWKLREIQALVASRIAPGTGHLITTRLDNDDAICRDYVRLIQERFRGQTLEFVSFPQGYIWREGKIFSCDLPAGPFASLIEKVDGCRTIYADFHDALSDVGPVTKITGRRAWIQTVHGRNQANHVRGIRQQARTLVESGDFALSPREFDLAEPPLWYWMDKTGSILRTLASRCRGKLDRIRTDRNRRRHRAVVP